MRGRMDKWTDGLHVDRASIRGTRALRGACRCWNCWRIELTYHCDVL